MQKRSPIEVVGEWVALFQLAGFLDVQSRQIDAKAGWAGTLCVVGAVSNQHS